MTTIGEVITKMRDAGGVGTGFQVHTISDFNRETGAKNILDEESPWAVKTITLTRVKDAAAAADLNGTIDERGRVRFTLAPEGDELAIGVVTKGDKDKQDHAIDVLRSSAGRAVKVTDRRK